MYVLGFNSTHDASAALVRSGEVRQALEEERLSRVRHHDGFPDRAIAAVLEADSEEYVEFSFRLDTSQLPRPLQIGIGGQQDWNLAVERLAPVPQQHTPPAAPAR